VIRRPLQHALDELRFGRSGTLNLRASLPTAAEAVKRAESWLRMKQAEGAREVLIVTGRGNHSFARVPVVREAVQRLLAYLSTRGVVEQHSEHSPGSFAVRLLPMTAAVEVIVAAESETARARIVGPEDSLLRQPRPITVEFLVHRDREANAAVIEGFGASTVPFDAFDKAFKRDLGFEASIGVRLVTQAQCPAIKFLSQIGGNQARAPRINLNSVEVRNGETLSGTIENFANRVVELLLVSDAGEVQSLSYLLKPGIDSLSFSIGMQRNGAGEGPQLVMAVATPQVLDSLRRPKPMAADSFFLQALSEAQRNNVAITTAARYFRLKN